MDSERGRLSRASYLQLGKKMAPSFEKVEEGEGARGEGAREGMAEVGRELVYELYLKYEGSLTRAQTRGLAACCLLPAACCLLPAACRAQARGLAARSASRSSAPKSSVFLACRCLLLPVGAALASPPALATPQALATPPSSGYPLALIGPEL